MEWLAIPGIMLGLTLVAVGITALLSYDDAWTVIMGLAMLMLLLFTTLICGTSHYGDRGNVRHAESFYDNIIMPHIVEEYDDYVVVDSAQAAIWQAGDNNLSEYNALLKSRRHWETVPLWSTVTYAPPERLKYVQVR